MSAAPFVAAAAATTSGRGSTSSAFDLSEGQSIFGMWWQGQGQPAPANLTATMPEPAQSIADQGNGLKRSKKKSLRERTQQYPSRNPPGYHVSALIILNFPSDAPDHWLQNEFKRYGFEVVNVVGKNATQKMRLEKGKSMFAFVNCVSVDAARTMKQEINEGRVVLTYKGKQWTLKCDWAKEDRSF
jgi:hypothetical protein